MTSLRYNLSLTALAIGLGAASADAATLRSVTTLHAAVVRLSDLFDDAGAGAIASWAQARERVAASWSRLRSSAP